MSLRLTYSHREQLLSVGSKVSSLLFDFMKCVTNSVPEQVAGDLILQRCGLLLINNH